MVVKTKTKKTESTRKPQVFKASIEDDDMSDKEEAESADVENENEIVEPAPKKVKRDITKEVEQHLSKYDAVIKDGDVKFAEKLSQLSSYLHLILENNANTLEFEINFDDWIKESLLILLEEGTATSEEFYDLLCSILKVCPAIIEPTCEKVFNFIFAHHHFSKECDLAFQNFMENLSLTFEKLRRYPKLIAKFLCCVRDNANGTSESLGRDGSKKFVKKMLGSKSKNASIFILPKRFMDTYASTIGMLPVGQVMDLWKTFHHNLEEECIRKYSGSNKSTITPFLSVLVDLFVTFLCSIKVADHTVPSSTVEKVLDMMNKLKENGISQLAKLLPTDYNATYTKSFLKLCFAWSYLYNFMSIYNKNFPSTFLSFIESFHYAVDLSFIFPQLSSEDWMSLWASIDRNEDIQSSSYMVCLVALKLKSLAIMQQERKDATVENNGTIKMKDNIDCEEVDDVLTKNISEAATFIWNNQQLLKEEQNNFYYICSCKDILEIVTIFLPQHKLMELAKSHFDNTLESTISSQGGVSDKLALSSNMKFRVAVLLESLQEGVKRVGKGNSLKRSTKRFLSECLNPNCKFKILQTLSLNENSNSVFDGDIKKYLMEAAQIVNDVMVKDKKIDNEEVVSGAVLRDVLSMVVREELSQYPKTVKTMICLNFLFIFTALIKYSKKESNDGIDDVAFVLSECGRNSQGNEILFQIKWTELYGLVKSNVNMVSENCVNSISSLVLENIYVSPKVASDFGEQHVMQLCTNDILEFQSMEGYLAVCLLSYIVEEVTGTKTKSASILNNHVRDLYKVFVKKLSDGSIIADLHGLIKSTKKNKRKSSLTPTNKNKVSITFLSRVIRSCYLLLKGKPCLNEEEKSEFSDISQPYLCLALDYIMNSGRSECNGDNGKGNTQELLYCLQFILEALKTFQECREKMPQDFLSQAWQSFCASDFERDTEIGIIWTVELPKKILEVANDEEFQTICNFTTEQMGSTTGAILIPSVLNSFICAEMASEKKKKARRSTIELGLFQYLEHVNSWKETDDFIERAIPYIQFQTSLLKRRKPMGSLSTLSICMSSVTSVPLDRVKSVESFKNIYSSICDLLNAMNVHRLDVLSFRSHILLQCFQFLVESLVKRADQRNKLTDEEIYHLRHCGHCIERVCQSAKLGREELTRISPYLIVVLLGQFEKITVYPTVKNPLLNGCYKLLDMCDDQGISHVNSMLSAGSREIFKTIYELYKKFYRYKGKV